jgi:DnaJ-class molecular chaperone
MTDHYQTLGVARDASAEEIKRAYRRLASQHHPDRGGDTATFQNIQTAYDVLGDENRRRSYDNPAPQFDGFPGGAFFNMNDIFSQMFGQQTQRRSHVRMTVWISLEEAVMGGSRTVNVSTPAGNTTVKIEIPQGIEDGDNVQYSGVAPGNMDLVASFKIHPHAQWRRNGLDLGTDVRVSVWDMILGAEIRVVSITGQNLDVKIPPNTQPGTTMRLRGHGIATRDGKLGDLMVKLQPEIPRNIAPEILDAIRQYR